MGDDSQTEPQMVGVLRAAVRRVLEAEGVSLNELARRVGVPAPTLSRFLNGHRGITFRVAATLCEALGLELVAVKRGRKAKG